MSGNKFVTLRVQIALTTNNLESISKAYPTKAWHRLRVQSPPLPALNLKILLKRRDLQFKPKPRRQAPGI